MRHFVITESDKARIEEQMKLFVKESGARFAILIDTAAIVISKAGDFSGIDIHSFAVLSAGGYASALALAKVIGEDEFFAAFHQGKRSGIHISVVGHGVLLVGVFDVSVTAGVIRLAAKDTAKNLEPIIFDILSKSQK